MTFAKKHYLPWTSSVYLTCIPPAGKSQSFESFARYDYLELHHAGEKFMSNPIHVPVARVCDEIYSIILLTVNAQESDLMDLSGLDSGYFVNNLSHPKLV